MWKLVIPALAVALTGCGGGSGSGSSGNSTPATSILVAAGTISTVSNFIPSLAAGNFDNTGDSYVIVSGWLANSSPTSTVKIYRLSGTGPRPQWGTGTITDATADVLGSEFAWSVNYPQVADFNRDGIDDIFFPGFTDGPNLSQNNASVVFLSRAGQSHKRVDLAGLTWNHGTTVLDANQDGWLDVINSNGEMWINTQADGFTYRAKDTFRTIKHPLAGAGVCAGDLDGSGDTQVVLTDQTGLQASQLIYKLNANMEPIYQGALPVPYFDKNNTDATVNRSHDVSCQIVDVNGDGRQDVVVISYLHDNTVTRTIGAQSMVQIYYNLGGYVFSDATDVSMSGYNQGAVASYTPKIVDFNGDGHADIWLMNTNRAESGNQVWLNDGTGKFKQSRKQDFNTLTSLHAVLNSVESNTSGIMLPVQINDKWNFIIATVSGIKNTVYVAYARTQWSFQ
jgi:hypothetical protein